MIDQYGNKIVIGEITRSDGSRMRQNKPSPKSRFDEGWYPLSDKNKYVGLQPPIHRSSLERRFMTWCESSPEIKGWDAEPFAIGYAKPLKASKKGVVEQKVFKQGNYYIDFVIYWKSGETWLVEVKPYSQTTKGSRDFPINKMKWNSAKVFSKKSGFKFIIITENFKPLKWIK